MSASCTLTVERTQSGYLVRIVGRGTMRESPTVRDFVISAMDDSAKIVLDLCDCDFLDSTFLGCLVLLHKHGCSRDGRCFTVLADEAARQRLMASNRLHLVFEFAETSPETSGDPVALPVAQLGQAEFGQHLLETHQKLAELGGPAAEAFRKVAEQLMKELGVRIV